ncbi:MAG TPA: MBL fold metallo-hydrolase [Verrucomicrobiae bacterium]|nr:MBL fold metallo-hydrolase [Verrucomicrobiae bacterium]
MKIHFLGATRTTTGSMYLFEINGRRLLLECGLFQGHREETTRRNCCFPFDPRQVDAVVLSHAHIDHAGNLPNLAKQGYEGPIHCTDATRDLCGIMLLDSAHIQEQDAIFVSKKRAKKNLPPVEPLYRVPDAEKAVQQLVGHPYGQPFSPVNGVTVTLVDAGHILGSAQVILDIQENGRKFRWLFSGDVGRGGDEILRDPVPVEEVDYLQIESTYGGRTHADRRDADQTICRLVGDTLRQQGKVIIPSFSVGRTQQIVYVLHQLTLSGCLPRVPIFVDSPLSVNATEIYRRHPECYNDQIAKFLREQENPFGMANLTYLTDAEDSKKLNDRRDPLIIISASGMCEAGRIRHHLANHIGESKNLVLFIGYCAEGTLGDQILKGRSPVNIFGEPHTVRARIASLDSYSGHADQNELKAYIRKITGSFRRIFCVHGEESQCLAHAETLRRLKPDANVLAPDYRQMIEI